MNNKVSIVIKKGRAFLTVNGVTLQMPRANLEQIVEHHRTSPNSSIHFAGFSNQEKIDQAIKSGLAAEDIDEMTTLTPKDLIIISTFFINNKSKILR